MTNSHEPASEDRSVAEATVEPKSRFSIVWLIPIAAALIALWLVYKAASEKGPTITIQFETGSGITAGKTKIKYRDVDVGVVEAVTLSEDIGHVELTVEMEPGAETVLSSETRFWVVRARVAAGEVTGLGTLFSGAYIAIDPIQLKKGEKRQKRYLGLDKPPAVTSDEPGKSFVLLSPKLGSVNIGAPVYYRQINVGRVTDYSLEDNGEIRIDVFIFSPHNQRIMRETRFWNAGGVDITVDASGLKIDTESLVSIMLGGIAFDTPVTMVESAPVPEGFEFDLYPNRRASETKVYRLKRYYLTHFDGSIRGLVPGSPVDLRGFRIGEVVDVRLEIDPETLEISTPVLIEIEPERYVGGELEDADTSYPLLLRQGMRAQLQTGNILTGQKVVALDFFPDEPPAEEQMIGRYRVIPSMPAATQEIAQDFGIVARNLSKVPFEQIGQDLGTTVAGLKEIVDSGQVRGLVEDLNATLAAVRTLMESADTEMAPALTSTLQGAEQTVASLNRMLDAETGTQREMTRLVIELTDASRTIKALVDYLERHPEALLRGKGEPR